MKLMLFHSAAVVQINPFIKNSCYYIPILIKLNLKFCLFQMEGHAMFIGLQNLKVRRLLPSFSPFSSSAVS